MTAAKIFVRERRKVEEGEKKPRYAIVGVAGVDLKVFLKHIRKQELEQMAAAVGAEVVYLQAGKDSDDDPDDE
ncbi:MAG: hypothetical protein ACM3MK_06335 [Chitinophagales bacterium]